MRIITIIKAFVWCAFGILFHVTFNVTPCSSDSAHPQYKGLLFLNIVLHLWH